MDSNERREEIRRILKEKTQPIKGTELARIFHVSRQIIVQDIAILRAAGENILATPQGYIFPFPATPSTMKKTIPCQHKADGMFEELSIIVDMGGKILDVMVEHPVYGELKAHLMISSRRELNDFIHAFEKLQAEPLSSLTEGVHLHNIQVPDEETYREILRRLEEKGLLVKE